MARYGLNMGFNVSDPLDTGILDTSDAAGTVWLRWGEEWPWYLNDATDHTSGWNNTLWTAFQSKMATVHARGKRGIVVALSVPTSINASSNSGNNWKYWPTNGTGDTAFAAYCVKLASYLTAGTDVLQIGNEINNVANFNLGDQTPARLAACIKAAIIAVRAAYPTLTIYSPSLCAVGDTGDTHSMVEWGSDFITAEPSLLTTNAPDAWTVHPYIWGGDTGSGGGVLGDNDPAGSQGWNGHIQADDWRAALDAAGLSSPVGLVITEFGEPSTPTVDVGDGYWTESWQNSHAQTDHNVIDYRRAVGWYAGPEIRHTCVDSSLAIDAGHEFGIVRSDLGRKALFYTVQARAARTDGTGGPGAGNFDTAISFNASTGFNDPSSIVVTEPPVSGAELVFTIEIGVPPTSVSFPTGWVVSSYARGNIDGPWVLGPDYEFIDVTESCQSWTVDRTSDREFNAPNAGTASVLIRDDRTDLGTARMFDPSNTASIFYPNLVARSKVRISVDGVVLFTGDITNLERNHDNYGATTTVSIQAADIFSRLASTQMVYTPEAVHNNQKRTARILERAGRFHHPTYIMPGDQFFQAGTEESGSALDLIAAVAFGERGLLYCNPSEVVVFLTSEFLAAAGIHMTVDDQSTGAAFFYSAVTEDNGNELLVNDVTVDSIDGDAHPTNRRNGASVQRYGLRSWPGGVIKTPIEPKEARRDLGDAIVDAFGDAVTRFRTVTIPTARFVADDRQTILSTDYGAKLRVKRTPIGSGTPATVSQDLYVIGIHHEGRPRYVESTFTLGPII